MWFDPTPGRFFWVDVLSQLVMEIIHAIAGFLKETGINVVVVSPAQAVDALHGCVVTDMTFHRHASIVIQHRTKPTQLVVDGDMLGVRFYCVDDKSLRRELLLNCQISLADPRLFESILEMISQHVPIHRLQTR